MIGVVSVTSPLVILQIQVVVMYTVCSLYTQAPPDPLVLPSIYPSTPQENCHTQGPFKVAQKTEIGWLV